MVSFSLPVWCDIVKPHDRLSTTECHLLWLSNIKFVFRATDHGLLMAKDKLRHTLVSCIPRSPSAECMAGRATAVQHRVPAVHDGSTI